ncbi:hypothetical protein N824_21140 [Pedobacter sp. V48]|nr:hypothetical protein N824_21140 [Pedobacter sp. V48]
MQLKPWMLKKIRLVQSTYRLNSKAESDLATAPMKVLMKFIGINTGDKALDTEIKRLN